MSLRRRVSTGVIAFLSSVGCAPPEAPPAAPSVAVTLDPSTVIGLAAGAEHTCALHAGGTVVCWGSNEFGQLGEGGARIAWTPQKIAAIDDAAQIAAAGGVTCARRKTGAVRCWGSVREGKLISSKDDIAGIEGAQDLAVGPDQLTVLLADGSIAQKNLRDTTPVRRVPGITTATQVTAGYRHACALLASGEVRCWGRNDMGELGNGSTRSSAAPVRVADLDDVKRIGTSQRGNCAWRRGGGTACWGNLGTGKPITEPFGLPLVSGMVGAAGALGKACAWYANGTVECVKRGAIGPDRKHVTGVHGVVQVVAGYNHFCALERSGRVLCWGSDEQGQLGDPHAAIPVPSRIPGITDARDLVVARSYACALGAKGNVTCWGQHPFGSDEGTAPRAISGLTAARLASNGYDACAIDRAESARCWGKDLGWAGIAKDAFPAPLPGLSGTRRVTLGFGFACALADRGQVRCFGKNRHGELGDGTLSERREAVSASGVEDAAEVATSDGLVCARLADGRVSCWGTTAVKPDSAPIFIKPSDDTYSLEPPIPNAAWVDGSIASPSPAIVAGLDQVTRIDRVGGDVCALRKDGTAACWSREDRLVPRPVEGLSHARALAGSRHHRCALLDDQRVACWGRNDFGELGTGAIGAASPRPVPAVGIEGVEQLAAGDGFTCARVRDGSIMCWGSNRYGELGRGGDYAEPVEVPRAVLRAPVISASPQR